MTKRIKSGDSLNRIARENNIALDRLLELNHLELQENIRPGQVLLLK
jgi:LysM repeat protein